MESSAEDRFISTQHTISREYTIETPNTWVDLGDPGGQTEILVGANYFKSYILE